MKEILQNITTRIFSLLASLASPAIQSYLKNWATNLAGDVPRIGSAWVVRLNNPTTTKTARQDLIDARLHQFGRRVSGIGFVQGEPGDPFEYDGFIRRNVFYGAFRRKDAHILAGTGTFVLKITADSRNMIGRCTWYESRIDAVWSSKYVWIRRG